jgi:hypothetical protein
MDVNTDHQPTQDQSAPPEDQSAEAREAQQAEAQAKVEEAEARVTEAEQASANAVEEAKKAEALFTEWRQHEVNCQEALKTIPAGEEHDEDRKKGQAAMTEARNNREGARVHMNEKRTAKKAAAEDLKTAKRELREAKRGVKAAQPPKQPRSTQPKRNDMVLPREGTISAKLWAIFDAAMAEKGSPPAFTEVAQTARDANVVEASIRAGYAHWRKYHGITGRVLPTQAPTPAQAEQKQEETSPA